MMWMIFLLMVCIVAFLLNDSIVVDEILIKSRKLNGSVRFAVLSDFHCGDAKRVIELLHSVNPDFILIPGDLIDENAKLDPVVELLDGIQKWTCFYVSGNHEFKKGRYHKDYEEFKKLLMGYGVICFENESMEVKTDLDRIWIGGIHDHCSNKLKHPDDMDRLSLEQTCYQRPDLYSILLMHRPEQYHLVETYGVDLLVSGHAHGGQWRFPGINGLFAPQQGLFPKRAGGLYSMKDGYHLVSRGLARYWFLPRILNHREVNVITIKKAD